MSSLKRLSTRHDLVMYACTLLAFFGVSANDVGPIFSFLFIFFWLVSWFFHRSKLARAIPIKLWNVVIISCVVGTAFMMYVSEDDVIAWGIRFILMLVALKLMSRRGGERDDWQIYALNFLLMAAGTADNEDIIYGLVFTLYVFFSTFGLALLHMRTEQERIGKPSLVAMNTLYSRILLALATLVLLSSMAIFFTFPRVGLGFFATKSRVATTMTGFSDKVELGSHGLIRDNPAVVLRVTFPDGATMPAEAESYHWRMMSFDAYDGSQWRRSRRDRPGTLDRLDGERRGYAMAQLYTPTLRRVLEGEPSSHVELYMEPMLAKQAPQLWPSRAISMERGVRIPFNPSSLHASYDSFYHDLYIEQRNELGFAFAIELLPQPAPALFRELSYEPQEAELHRDFLQLPEGLERTADLGAEITRQATTPYQKAVAIQTYLNTNYTYTTDLPPVAQDNPLEDFLFRTRRGHCEFFASSMTLLLRTQGIPARLVNGFLGGVWNASGGYMAVRQGDAHSWVEVYMPQYGWVPFDPTPADGTRPVQHSGLEQELRDLYDAARMRWMTWVVEYNLESQIAGLRRLSAMLSPSVKSSPSESEERGAPEQETPKTELPIALLITGIVLLALGLWSARITRRAFVGSTSPAGVALARYLWRIGWLSIAGAIWLGWQQEWRPLMIVAGGANAWAFALLARFTPQLGQSTRQQSHRLDLAFARIEHGARRQQLRRAPDEGPARFLDRLAMHAPLQAETITRFKQRYLIAKFGQRELSPEQLTQLEQLAAQISKAL